MNPHKLADALDALRVVPRAMMFTYMYIVAYSVGWVYQLPDPSTQQVTFAGVVVGAGAAWFKIYVDSGKKRGNDV